MKDWKQYLQDKFDAIEVEEDEDNGKIRKDTQAPTQEEEDLACYWRAVS